MQMRYRNFTYRSISAMVKLSPQVNANMMVQDYIGGKLLGGSSAINGMQYVRGTPYIYTKWQQMAGGDPAWGPDAALETYKEMENFLDIGSVPNPSVHGTSGAMSIRLAPIPATQIATVLASAIHTAYSSIPIVTDYNDPANSICTFTQWQLYQHADRTRGNSAFDYLTSDVVNASGMGVNGRKLRILYNSTVLKIIFEGTNATGVTFLHNGKFIRAISRQKVIVCSGIQTPALLMRSGVGPRNVLQTAGVPVIVDSPNVGSNFTNQPFVVAVLSVPASRGVGIPPTDLQSLYTGGAFMTDSLLTGDTTRKFQLIGSWTPGQTSSDPSTLTLIVVLLQPESVGSIKIINNDPLQLPLVDDNFLANSSDVTRLIDALLMVQTIAASLPGYTIVTPSDFSRDALETYIRTNLSQTHHWSTSCRMGTNITNGVVDSSGYVFGTKDLMIVDATICPVQNEGNTSSFCYFAALTIAKKLGLR
jgi:choline dehydrogenase